MSERRPMLPVVGESTAERADAARNRRALLAAAREMLACDGVEALSLDRLASRAGVGVGTVYRRFGDRGGLAYALLDDAERRFQEGILSGPPPLGPGAPPAQRIRAFLHAYLDRLEVEADLHAMGEGKSPTSRFTAGAYRTHRTHLTSLLAALCPRQEAAYLAEVLLGMTGAGLFIDQRRARGIPLADLKAGIDLLLDRLGLTGGDPASRTTGDPASRTTGDPASRTTGDAVRGTGGDAAPEA